MGLSAAVQWWEQWQLRILVLAIYSLAALFNRRRKQEDIANASSKALEAMWVPILLMHLGGQDGITAYNIEDNELWRRHVLTAVSQVTVAVYVFCKSWPGGDNNLLKAAILLFIPGVLKCLEKPLALKNASINSLVSSSEPAQRTANREGEINLLEQYVRKAKDIVLGSAQCESQDREQEGGNLANGNHHLAGDKEGDAAQGDQHEPQEERGKNTSQNNGRPQPQEKERDAAYGNKPYLFVDLASPYDKRLSILKSFWLLNEEKAYSALQADLSTVFNLLYTKEKTFSMTKLDGGKYGDLSSLLKLFCSMVLRTCCCIFISFVAIGLFHHSHREGYNNRDVKITYILLCCTAALEIISLHFSINKKIDGSGSSGRVPQYSLVGFFVRNKKHPKKMSIVSFFGCKDYLDQHWCLKSCSSSQRITVLVLRYLKEGWRDYVEDAASYRMFNDHRGQWTLTTLERNKCNHLAWSINCPFDESVLIWHIATDFCFYSGAFPGHKCDFSKVKPAWQTLLEPGNAQRKSVPSPQSSPQCGKFTRCKAVQCRQMSNYMMYLLFVNPEMLLPGSRRNLFTTAYDELRGILEDKKPVAPMEGGAGTRQGNKPPAEEKEVTQSIITKLKSTQESQKEGFIHDAWSLAQGLLALGDEEKMWEVIEGVWVEMLCFSAGRCRGYLHAKALCTGGELLTYIWLALSHMGMETLAEKLQRTELQSSGGNTRADAGEDIV